MSFFRKALFAATGGTSGLVVKANSKKERTAKAAEKQARYQKEQLRLQQRVVAHTPTPNAVGLSIADELAKFVALRNQGALSDEEFEAIKNRLLSQVASPGIPRPDPQRDWSPIRFDQDREMWVCTPHDDPDCHECPNAFATLSARNAGRSRQ